MHAGPGPGQTRDCIVAVRFTAQEKRRLWEAADQAGTTPSDLLRDAWSRMHRMGDGELLRIMGEIVQQNILLRNQERVPINMEEIEQEAARVAPVIWARRRKLLEDGTA